MIELNNYIIEKLKLNKDSVSEIKEAPYLGEPVIILYHDKDDVSLEFGKVTITKKSKKNNIEEFKVEYTVGRHDRDNWFFYICEPEYNFIGASETPRASVYTYNFTLQELNRMLKNNDNKFDGWEVFPNKAWREFCKMMIEMIKDELKSKK